MANITDRPHCRLVAGNYYQVVTTDGVQLQASFNAFVMRAVHNTDGTSHYLMSLDSPRAGTVYDCEHDDPKLPPNSIRLVQVSSTGKGTIRDLNTHIMDLTA